MYIILFEIIGTGFQMFYNMFSRIYVSCFLHYTIIELLNNVNFLREICHTKLFSTIFIFRVINNRKLSEI